MDGMDSNIMDAIMEALGHVNGDEEGKKGKKMAITVIDAAPEGEMEEMHDEPPMDHHMEDDAYLEKLKGMEPKDEAVELPQDDWSEKDMDMHGPSMMMQLAALKKKKPSDEEDEGDHEYR